MQACQEGADVPFFTVCWYPFALKFSVWLELCLHVKNSHPIYLRQTQAILLDDIN